MFPYVKDAPSHMPLSPRSPPPQTTSLRSQKPAWHRAPKSATVLDNRQRLLIFVAGGVTYSEVREMYQLSASLQKDIYIGEFAGHYLWHKPKDCHQALHTWLHLEDLLMTSKFLILVVQDQKPYPMGCATCEENRNHLKNSMMRNILLRTLRLHNSNHPRRPSLDFHLVLEREYRQFNHHRRIPSKAQSIP